MLGNRVPPDQARSNIKMRDRRLLGVWRSDKRRTLRELRARQDLSQKARHVIGGLLGKLELKFTSTRCYSTLEGNTSSAPYTVVAKDRSSVAIVSRDAILGEDTISHIHFEGSWFWISVGRGALREFFTRLEPPTDSRKATSRFRRISKAP